MVSEEQRKGWEEEKQRWITACRQAGFDVSLVAEILDDISDPQTFEEMCSLVRRLGIAGSVETVMKK